MGSPWILLYSTTKSNFIDEISMMRGKEYDNNKIFDEEDEDWCSLNIG